jgi:hypothetical protein
MNTFTNGEPLESHQASYADETSYTDKTSHNDGVSYSDNTATALRTEEQLAALFAPEVANEYRSRWDVVQRGFVDDPKLAVRQGDELVAEVMKNLADSFSSERATLEGQLKRADQASTETLRIALRRYRSFFERLLAF